MRESTPLEEVRERLSGGAIPGEFSPLGPRGARFSPLDQSCPAVYFAADGRTVETAAGPRTLRLRGAVLEPLAEFLSRPGAAALLALIVLYKVGDAAALSLSTAFLIKGVHFTAAEVGAVVVVDEQDAQVSVTREPLHRAHVDMPRRHRRPDGERGHSFCALRRF